MIAPTAETAKTATQARFAPGDRVRLAIPTAFNSGRSGTVVSRVVSNETLLRVRWDGAKHERTVAEARLKKSYTPSPEQAQKNCDEFLLSGTRRERALRETEGKNARH
jgi:hypothetical protein